MPPTKTPSEIELNPEETKRNKDERRRIIIALLFLLLSFCCIFCSSQSALWFIDRSRIEASMLSDLRADYGEKISLGLAPLEGDIAAEAEQDEALLLLKQTPIAGGLGIVPLPNPIPTPKPTAIALLPVPTPAGSGPSISGPSTPLPVVPPPTSVALPPTRIPPTSPLPPTVAPPTVSPPTVPPPTVSSPTAPPPTVSSPTVSPPTAPPSTDVPPTEIPPTIIPTPATNTPTATSTPTNTPTATSTPTNTPTPPIRVYFAAVSFSTNENAGATLITVNLSAASMLTVTVNYATSDGTATAGVDYIAAANMLTFAPGTTSRTFSVTILDDNLDELDETVNLTLSTPTNAILDIPNSAVLTIIDDDPPPMVQFSNPTYNIGEADGVAAITVTLSMGSALPVTVDYATANGTAITGSDYISTSGMLTFPPFQTTRIFTVTIINDVGEEPPPDETVILTLSDSANATIGPTNPATLTITDDDTGGPCSTPQYILPSSIPPNAELLGPPDCGFTFLANYPITITLSTPINVDSNPDFDLVYYEREGDPPSGMGSIALDRITIQISADGVTWYTVFLWGDTILDTNTNIGQAGYGGTNGEPDNTSIPMSTPPLFRPTTGPITGIAIDVDNPVVGPPPPSGSYTYVRLVGVFQAEVDSIEVLP